jgi:hypothetical protein
MILANKGRYEYGKFGDIIYQIGKSQFQGQSLPSSTTYRLERYERETKQIRLERTLDTIDEGKRINLPTSHNN